MKKWIGTISMLTMIFILASFTSKTTKKVSVPSSLKVNEPTMVLFPKDKTTLRTTSIFPPFIGSSYVGFKEALGFKESSGNYFITNTYGYLGKYQFGIATLNLMGVYNASQFLRDPELQERAFYTNMTRNKWILRKDIGRFKGKRIKGVQITESGILAAAHLAGAGNVKRFLRSYGNHDKCDAYGTSISAYLQKFGGYDLSGIRPKRNPKV